MIRSTTTNAGLLRTYLKPYWPAILAASICSIVLGLISTLVVTAIGPSIMLLLEGSTVTPVPLSKLVGHHLAAAVSSVFPHLHEIDGNRFVEIMPWALVTVAALKAGFQFASWYLWEWLAEGASADLRRDLVGHYVSLAPHCRDRINEDQLSSVVTTDCKLIREYIVHFYGGFPREALQMVFMIVTQLLLSLKLCLMFFVGVLPLWLLVTRLGKKLKGRASKALQDYSFLSEWLQQRLLGISTIKHYRTESTECREMSDKAWQLYNRLIRAARVKARTAPMIELCAIGCLVVVLWVALNDIELGTLTGPVALSFISSLALLAQSGAACGRYYNANREGAAAVGRVREAIAELRFNRQFDLNTAPRESSTTFRLKASNLDVRYPGSREPALSNFSATFEPNRIYCLVGPSGSGKSTFFRAVLGLVPLTAGKIVHGVQDQRPLEIGYVPQKIELGSGNIAEQVSYPDSTWDTDGVWRALRAVRLDEFVANLPEQERTTLGDGGPPLSGGQAQRLLLARLFYRPYGLILIDEGTSALDPSSERAFYDAVKELAASATIMIIAHRPMALEYADHAIKF